MSPDVVEVAVGLGGLAVAVSRLHLAVRPLGRAFDREGDDPGPSAATRLRAMEGR